MPRPRMEMTGNRGFAIRCIQNEFDSQNHSRVHDANIWTDPIYWFDSPQSEPAPEHNKYWSRQTTDSPNWNRTQNAKISTETCDGFDFTTNSTNPPPPKLLNPQNKKVGRSKRNRGVETLKCIVASDIVLPSTGTPSLKPYHFWILLCVCLGSMRSCSCQGRMVAHTLVLGTGSKWFSLELDQCSSWRRHGTLGGNSPNHCHLGACPPNTWPLSKYSCPWNQCTQTRWGTCVAGPVGFSQIQTQHSFWARVALFLWFTGSQKHEWG